MKLKGKVRRFEPNNDINTDYIISGRYKFKSEDMNELAQYVMEDIRPGFFNEIEPGDFIVAGNNFGCGSSREQAPRVIKAARLSAVLAKSYARIFYRNSFNVGLPLLMVDTDGLEEGEEVEVDLDAGTLTRLSTGETRTFPPLSKTAQKLLEDGGLIAHLKQHGGFKFD